MHIRYTVMPTKLNKKFVVLFQEIKGGRQSVVSRHEVIEDAEFTASRLNSFDGK